MAWTDTEPVIDGHLDDAVWEEAAVVGDLTQVVPVTGTAPTQHTEIFVLTTKEALFFGARMHDTNPEEIVANVMVREGFVFFDDRFQIVIDTFHDHQNGYSFEVNPNGSRRDVTLEGKAFQFSWDTIWFAQVSVDDEGWTVEIKIPYQSINFDPESDTWGINFSRGIRRNSEEDRWADPHPQRFPSDFGNAGIMEGMLGIGQGLGLDVVPAATFRHIDDPLTPEEDTRADFSGDVFYKMTPSLTATITANTNFGEIEADSRQVNFSRFAIAFPEKRDFFLQDGLIFGFGELTVQDLAQSPENGRPFFSRRIGIAQPDPDVDLFEPLDILFGAKVTGRVGNRVKLGLLHTLIEAFEDIDKQNLTVGRVAMNVLGESSIGLIGTYGDPEGRVDNGVVGADFLYRNSFFLGDKTLTGSAWFQRSFTSGEDRNESAYGGTLKYPNDIVNWKLGFKEIGEGFNPALGFVNRPGIRQYDGTYRYRVRRTGYLRTFDMKVEGRLITDRDDTVETAKLLLVPVSIENSLGGRIDFRYRHNFDRPLKDFPIPGNVVIPKGSYHYNQGAVKLSTSRNRPIAIDLTLGGGQFYDGTRLFAIPHLTWRPTPHWLFEASYEVRDISLPGGDSLTHVARGTIGVFFNPDISWQTLVQYDNVSNSIGINSRFRWIIQDGRELFLVLNQGLDVEDGVQRGRTEPLVKLSWTFRF
ncbi:MAG: carbohydrate binding family 9 domain-containing protein [Myxococcales bacterium]|nr:carbohydrate binding family 9 domain-containing protein [Myxococcales bacterium]